MHVALTKQPVNQFATIQKSRQQALRAYCPNIYTVISTNVDAPLNSKMSDTTPSFYLFFDHPGHPFAQCKNLAIFGFNLII